MPPCMTWRESGTLLIERERQRLPPDILDEIHDAYPDIHTATREIVCELDPTDVIIAKVEALTDLDIIEFLASYISDAIVSELEYHDDAPFQLTQTEADEIMTLVRKIDLTDSNVAASIRDTIRDNFEHITV